MLTLFDCRQEPAIKNVIKFCNGSADFLALVNQATRKLMRRGDWWGTVVPIYVCIRNGCVVWPRYVGNVRRLNICNRTIPVSNMWGTFLDGKMNGCHNNGWGGWAGPQCTLTNEGNTSVFQDIQGDGRTIRSYARCTADYGRKNWVFGTDNNGQPLMTDNGNGTFTPGLVFVNALPFGTTNTFVRHIDYIVRESTQLPVDYYAYNASTNLLEDLAHYEPSETRPSYERTKLGGNWSNNVTTSCSPGCCQSIKGVLAMVKLKYIPAINDLDLVLIDNMDALALEIQSIKFAEAGDRTSALEYEADAIRELQRQLEDESPDDQFSVIDNTFGGRTFSNTCF